MKNFLFIIFLLTVYPALAQQTEDTLPPVQDTITETPRSIPRPQRPRVSRPVVRVDTSAQILFDSTGARIIRFDSLPPIDSVFFSSLKPWDPAAVWKPAIYHFRDPTRIATIKIERSGKETMFYLIIGLLLFFAVIRNSSYKYLQELLRVFFRTSVKQRQVKDQLIQNPLSSLLLNIFYVLSGAIFIALTLQYLDLAGKYNFWILFIFGISALISIYSVKFLTLKLMGWIFQLSDATDTYIFIVFTTNKIIGIALLPFIILLAFTSGTLYKVAFTLSIVVLAGLFAYRYFLSYVSIHRKIEVSFFHFLLYLFAFEVAPLLLINKLLFRFLGETY